MSGISTSASLLQRVRRMEPAAWERLCSLYGPLVYSWCRRTRLRESDASDIVQEVFRSVFEHIDQFEGQQRGTFRGWLWTITTNQIRLHFRQNQDRTQAKGGTDALRELTGALAADVPDEEPDGEASRRRLLLRALDLVKSDFSERTWTIFERATLRHESYRDIATDLGMSENAVRQARFRVLCRLREELAELI